MKTRVAFTGVVLLAVAACASTVAVPASGPPRDGWPPAPRQQDRAANEGSASSRERSAAVVEPKASSKPEVAPSEASPEPTRKSVMSRRLDRKKLEARGEAHLPALGHATLEAATRFNNETWAGEQRRELLAYLRGREADPTAKFEDPDARTIARIQRGSGAEADGKLRDETIAVLLYAGLHFSQRPEKARRVQIDFYPSELEDRAAWDAELETNGDDYRTFKAPEGEGVLYVRAGGRIVASYRARGGPPSTLQDDEHVADPTLPGSFILGAPHVHVSKGWENSQIPWGAEIREQDGGYQFRWPGSGVWRWATARDGPTLDTPLKNELFEDLPRVVRDGQELLLWTKNDFGPTAWQLIPSTNYVHTTPSAEEATAHGLTTILSRSHGCVHIDPRERDEMVQRGYLTTDIAFVVHTWSENILPKTVRSEMLRGVGAAAPSRGK